MRPTDPNTEPDARRQVAGKRGRLAAGMHQVMLWLNAAIAWGIFLTVSALNLAVSVGLQLFTLPWDGARRVALRVNHLLWGRTLFALQPGWPATREGTEGLAEGPYIIVANHSSVLDIPLCMGLPLPIRVLAKKSLLRTPLMGWYLRFSKQVTIDTSSPIGVQRAMENCQSSLSEGISLLIFPEGTRSGDAQVRRFQRGAFRLSKDTGVPVLPVAIYGTHRLMTKGHLIPQAIHHPITMRVFAPVKPTAFSTTRNMSNHVHALIEEAVQVMRRETDSTCGASHAR